MRALDTLDTVLALAHGDRTVRRGLVCLDPSGTSPLGHFAECFDSREMDFVQNARAFGVAEDDMSVRLQCALSLGAHLKQFLVTGIYIDHGEQERAGALTESISSGRKALPAQSKCERNSDGDRTVALCLQVACGSSAADQDSDQRFDNE